ncbi:hypothetical protein JHFBIEKO_0372 [Methylobacterium mesophilicum]|jgi:uncharacterized protein with PIN domain|nr:hypothetical protein JHFBIEKO_0372 [Methylobacterium mesophilicum]
MIALDSSALVAIALEESEGRIFDELIVLAYRPSP